MVEERTAAQHALVAAVDRLGDCGLDEAADGELSVELGVLETEIRKLTARQHRIARTLTRRRAARREQAGERADRAASRASREVGQQLGDQLQWTPAEAAQACDIGRGRDQAPAVGDALDDGQLPPRHARVLLDTLEKIADPALRAHAETRLLEAAKREHAAAFGRTCRRLLAELDPPAAERAAEQRHRRRRAKTTTTPDGMFALHAELAGIDAETLATGLDAFRRPDTRAEQRSPGQATADALVEMATAALRAGDAPTSHGIRPHVVITIDHDTLTSGRGVAEGTWMGPLPISEARRALTDAQLSALLTDQHRVPLQATSARATAPAGLYRALLARDRGCIAAGCDAPPAWCDVMHLQAPACDHGRLTVDNAALGCRQHHRAYDNGRLRLHWNNGHPALGRRPARPAHSPGPLPQTVLDALHRQNHPPQPPEPPDDEPHPRFEQNPHPEPEPSRGPEPQTPHEPRPGHDRERTPTTASETPGRYDVRPERHSARSRSRLAEPGRNTRPDSVAPSLDAGDHDHARPGAATATTGSARRPTTQGSSGHQQITASVPSG